MGSQASLFCRCWGKTLRYRLLNGNRLFAPRSKSSMAAYRCSPALRKLRWTAKEHARDYERFGAEGLMVFPSLGYKTDPRETVAWYKGIASASSLPIMIYNNPIAYGVDVTPAILRELADTPEIICVKEESGDIRRVTDIFIVC